jgi:hypothetical protein
MVTGGVVGGVIVVVVVGDTMVVVVGEISIVLKWAVILLFELIMISTTGKDPAIDPSQ